jgi:hypothetical protein
MRSKKRRISPASLAAIAPYSWQPGESGNPAGRPTKNTVRGSLLEMLGKECQRDGEKVTKAEALARMVLDAAMGDKELKPTQLDAVRFLVEQIEGKPRQTIANEGVSTLVQVANMSDRDLRERRREVARELRNAPPALPVASGAEAPAVATSDVDAGASDSPPALSPEGGIAVSVSMMPPGPPVMAEVIA